MWVSNAFRREGRSPLYDRPRPPPEPFNVSNAFRREGRSPPRAGTASIMGTGISVSNAFRREGRSPPAVMVSVMLTQM